MSSKIDNIIHRNFLNKNQKIENEQNSVFAIIRPTNKIRQCILSADPCLWGAMALPQSYNI